MGSGIATSLALSGVPTTVVVRRAGAVDETRARIADRLRAQQALGLIDAARARDASRAIEISLDAGPAAYDLVVECVSEDSAVKREVLARLEPALAEDGLLTSTTSSLRVDVLGSALTDPGRFLGWHWFHPADLVPLVEVVPGKTTRPVVTEQLRAWTAALGKTPLCLRADVPGFVANRLQYALLREAYALVERGVCSPEDVDLAVTGGLGLRWSAAGPFELMDLAGLDVHAAVVEALAPELDRSTTTPRLLAELRESGARGVKNGRGLRGAYTESDAERLVARRDRALAAAASRSPALAYRDGRFDALHGGRDLSADECAGLARRAAELVDVSGLDRTGGGEALLLWRDEHSEAWLNLWWEPRDTGYHDHHGSCVGVHVIEGRARNEPLVFGTPRRVSEYGPGESFAFAGHGIHRMDHDPGAITIHVYSPPIRSIGHYEIEDGQLRRRPSSPDEPSSPSPALLASLEAHELL
jgi:3-hydroxybutyryl-CoA dehydrogenase